MSELLGWANDLKAVDAAYLTDGSWDRTPPNGFGVSCKGLRTIGKATDKKGVIFQVNVPANYSLMASGTGLLKDTKLGTGDRIMSFYLQSSANARAATPTYDITFNATDVDGDDWTAVVQLQVNSGGTTSNYNYTFKKRGSGGGD